MQLFIYSFLENTSMWNDCSGNSKIAHLLLIQAINTFDLYQLTYSYLLNG